MRRRVTVGGREFAVELNGPRGGVAAALVDGKEVLLTLRAGAGEDLEVIAEAGARRVQVRRTCGAAGSGASTITLLAGGRRVEARVETEQDRLRGLSKPRGTREARVLSRSTLPGIIRRILRVPGDDVAEGEPLLTLEAMKMENEIRAEAKGRVKAVLVREGQIVNAGDALVEIDCDAEGEPKEHR